MVVSLGHEAMTVVCHAQSRLNGLVRVIDVVLVFLVRQHLSRIVLIGAQKALAISSCCFHSSETGSESLIGNLVALGIGASVHTLIHSVHLVLCLTGGFLWDTTVGLSLRSDVLGLMGVVLTGGACNGGVG